MTSAVAAVGEGLEQRRPVGEALDLEAEILELGRGRFTEILIVLDEHQLYRPLGQLSLSRPGSESPAAGEPPRDGVAMVLSGDVI